MKTNKIRTLLIGVMLLTLASIRATGRLGHAIDVAALVESADVIVSGRETSISEQGTTTIELGGGTITGKKFIAVIMVDETLKGTIDAGQLSFEFAITDGPSVGIPLGQYGIFFLNREQAVYKLSDPIHPFLPALPSGRSSGGLPLDRVVERLGEVLTYQGLTEFEKLSALDALGSLRTEYATATLQHASAITSGDLQLRIAAKLVARNDIFGLGVVENALLHPTASSDYATAGLAGSLGGLRDPRSVPALKRLLEINNPQITKPAAIALRQSGSADALTPLSRLLNDSDEQVRYIAVIGLGEITKQDEWTPAFSEFHGHEAKYLSYWRVWAASNLRETQK